MTFVCFSALPFLILFSRHQIMPKVFDYFVTSRKVFGGAILNFSDLDSISKIEEFLFSRPLDFNEITDATRNSFVYLNCE